MLLHPAGWPNNYVQWNQGSLSQESCLSWQSPCNSCLTIQPWPGEKFGLGVLYSQVRHRRQRSKIHDTTEAVHNLQVQEGRGQHTQPSQPEVGSRLARTHSASQCGVKQRPLGPHLYWGPWVLSHGGCGLASWKKTRAKAGVLFA